MPDFTFHVEDAVAVSRAVAPTLAFRLRIDTGDPWRQIHSMLLRCQIQIEATRRRYGEGEQQRLFDLFGEPRDWGRTLRSLSWTEINASVPAFTGSAEIDLPVACTYDFNVAATKYFDALPDGEVPLCFLFTGTVFYAGASGPREACGPGQPSGAGPLQVGQIPWETEAKYRLPVRVWRDTMDRYYPDEVWLPLSKGIFDRLREFQRRAASPTMEAALQTLLQTTQPRLVEAGSE